MTGAVDISASAVERLRVRLVMLDSRAGRRDAADMVVALRAALDAVERERDEADARGDDWHEQATKFRHERDAADATGYERGVRDAFHAMDALPDHVRRYAEPVILALLPADAQAALDAVVRVAVEREREACAGMFDGKALWMEDAVAAAIRARSEGDTR